jgi:hypothetical protein
MAAGIFCAATLALVLLPGVQHSQASTAASAPNSGDTPFEVELRLRWNGVGGASGTVLEAAGPSGRVLGIGFPETFNTVRHHRDRHLSVFVRDGDRSSEVVNLHHPERWMTAVFHRDGLRGQRLSVLNAPLGWQRCVPADNPGQWIQIDRQVFSYNAVREYGHDAREFGEDCGFVMIGRIDHGLFGNCLISTAGVLYFRPIAVQFGIAPDHRLRPVYFDDRVLVLQHVDERSRHPGFVACTLSSANTVENCSYTKFENPDEFVYALGSQRRGVAITSNFGNIWWVSGADAAVARLLVSDGTSLQLYAAVRYGKDIWWGEYPTGSVMKFDSEGRLQRTQAQLPIDNYRHSAAAELQTFAIYKGDLFAGVWPYGQVFRHELESGNWSLLRRFFSGPPIEAGGPEPFRDLTGTNEAGQRITDMIAHGDSLYVATSSKSGSATALPAEVRAQPVGEEYGNVYRVRMTGALSVGLPAGSDLLLRVRLTRDAVEIVMGEEVLARTRIDSVGLGCIDRITLLEGTFGSLVGPSSDSVVRVNRLACRG